MPIPYKFFVLSEVRCVDPFFYLDLGTVFLCTFMDLNDIFKSIFRIISSQWKQPAESRTNLMYGASAFLIQENAFFFCSAHCQMWQNIAIRNSKFKHTPNQFFRYFPETSAQSTDIIRIQKDRISHPCTAVMTAFAVLTICFDHIIRII